MKWLNDDAKLICKHSGTIENKPSQDWVRVSGHPVLVEPDPEGRHISRCPNVGATIKACINTLRVREGYSEFIRVGGKPVCLDTVTGITDGTPPGVVPYIVKDPGQELVAEAEG